MPFPQSFLDELMARSDIVDVVGSYVQLTRKGANLFGLCPFHSEKTGSFSVSPDKQIYYCFGCKRGGGVINFIMEEENLSFPDAVRFLAKRAGMEVPEEDGDREAGRIRQSCTQCPSTSEAALRTGYGMMRLLAIWRRSIFSPQRSDSGNRRSPLFHTIPLISAASYPNPMDLRYRITPSFIPPDGCMT